MPQFVLIQSNDQNNTWNWKCPPYCYCALPIPHIISLLIDCEHFYQEHIIQSMVKFFLAKLKLTRYYICTKGFGLPPIEVFTSDISKKFVLHGDNYVGSL
jgi:hypothetical protein